MSKRILAASWLPCVLFLLPHAMAAQDRVPIQAELVRAMEAGRVKAGDPVFAKVTAKWQGPQCALRQGAVLKGRIVTEKPRSKTEKTSEIALVFDSGQCDGHDLKPLPLTVAALLAADPQRDRNMYEYQPLSDAVGLSLNGDSARETGGNAMRSITTAAATVYVSPPRYRGPTAVMPGQVIGIKGVNLKVGSGPEGSSILSTTRHNVRLESGAQLVLVPNLNAASAAEPGATAPTAPAVVAPSGTEAAVTKAPASTELVDESEVCSPPQCSVALASTEDANASAAWATLSIKDLGYVPDRPDYAMYSFDYASALSYLGPQELLFTFNPHGLVSRNNVEAKFSKLHVIRAVVIDVQEKKVAKTVDWKVADARQYLWPVGRDRVLVHVGQELRMYGPGLKLEQHLTLYGPLAFVRTSPSSRYLAVGVILERHSEGVHRQLEEAEQQAPEEDVEVRVMDTNLHVMATVMRSSRAIPPVLSDDGEIRVLGTSKNHWRIVENTWDEQEHTLAHLSSSCRPEVTTLSPDFLFVVGCDRQTAGKWYRVLRPDGKAVLKGSSSLAELEHTAHGVATGATFAIGMAVAIRPILAESAFQTSDIESEHIAVFRAENGQRMFSITVPSPEPTVQTFVLSPDGNQLAVLRGDQIAFYEMPASVGH